MAFGLLEAAALCGTGCSRDALPDYCPVVEIGELVVSEIRGPQAGADAYGDFIEVYNAGPQLVNLQGMTLRLVAANGDELEFFVRDPLELAAGAYAAVGPGFQDQRPGWLDYSLGWDISGGDPETEVYPRDLLRYDSAFVEIEACGRVIDRAFYAFEGLPTGGTLACGNASTPPSADANDLSGEGCWCIDAGEPGPEDEGPGIGLPGTPGGANRCL